MMSFPLGPCWVFLGTPLESSLGPLWVPFGSVVGLGWVIFGFTRGSHRDPHRVCVGFELGPLWGRFGTTLGLPLTSGFPLGRLWVHI